MTDKTTVVDGEARVRAMTTEVLKANLPACVKAETQWGQMARGELEEKPDCPFCGIKINGDNSCRRVCALHMFDCNTDGEHNCGAVFYAWVNSLEDFEDDIFRSVPVCTAAGAMTTLLGCLRAVIEDELAVRAAREIDEMYSREAVESARVCVGQKVYSNGMTASDKVRWIKQRDHGVGTVVADDKLDPDKTMLIQGSVPVRFDGYAEDGGYFDERDYHNVPPEQLIRIVEPSQEQKSWCGFDERTLVWYEKKKTFAVVCDPDGVRKDLIARPLANGYVFVRLTGEPTLRFDDVLAVDLVRVSCETCSEAICREDRERKKAEGYTIRVAGFDKCWKYDAPVPSPAEPAPRIPSDFPCILGMIGLTDVQGMSFDEPTRSPRCVGSDCPLWSWLESKTDAE